MPASDWGSFVQFFMCRVMRNPPNFGLIGENCAGGNLFPIIAGGAAEWLSEESCCVPLKVQIVHFQACKNSRQVETPQNGHSLFGLQFSQSKPKWTTMVHPKAHFFFIKKRQKTEIKWAGRTWVSAKILGKINFHSGLSGHRACACVRACREQGCYCLSIILPMYKRKSHFLARHSHRAGDTSFDGFMCNTFCCSCFYDWQKSRGCVRTPRSSARRKKKIVIKGSVRNNMVCGKVINIFIKIYIILKANTTTRSLTIFNRSSAFETDNVKLASQFRDNVCWQLRAVMHYGMCETKRVEVKSVFV